MIESLVTDWWCCSVTGAQFRPGPGQCWGHLTRRVPGVHPCLRLAPVLLTPPAGHTPGTSLTGPPAHPWETLSVEQGCRDEASAVCEEMVDPCPLTTVLTWSRRLRPRWAAQWSVQWTAECLAGVSGAVSSAGAGRRGWGATSPGHDTLSSQPQPRVDPVHSPWPRLNHVQHQRVISGDQAPGQSVSSR